MTHQTWTRGNDKSWRAHIDDRGPRHVWPLNDLARHVVNGQQCWCKPTLDGNLVIHHSLDGREFKEAEAAALAKGGDPPSRRNEAGEAT